MRAAGLIAAAMVCLSMASAQNSSAANPGEEYVFRVDGESVMNGTDSLTGNAELGEGDVISIGNLNITLEKGRAYNFENKLKENGCLYRVNDDGSKTVIGVKIGTLLHEEELTAEEKNAKLQEFRNSGSHGLPPLRMKTSFVFTNPLEKMTKEQIRQLRGVSIEDWNDTLADKLPFISPQACIQIGCAEEDAGNVLATLPRDIEYMVVYYRKEIAEKLPMFKNLKFLAVGSESREVDASILAENINLVNLDLAGFDNTIAASLSLSRLKNLRSLNLSGMKDLKNAKFVSSMKGLRYLNIDMTGVTDLRCLDELQELREVSAKMAPVGMLPQGKFPKLERMNVMGSRLSLKDVEDFEARNQNCTVMFKWNRTIPRILAEATRVEVRGPAAVATMPGELHAADSNVASVMKLAENLAVDPCESESILTCIEDFHLVFYNGSRQLASFAVVCSDVLRWDEAWPTEARLTKASGDYIAKWLTGHGYDWMLKGRKKDQQEQEKNTEEVRKSFDEFLATMPEDVSKAIMTKYKAGQEKRDKRRQESAQAATLEYEHISEAIASTIKATYPDDVNRAKACLTALALYTNKREGPMGVLRELLRDISMEKKGRAAEELMNDARGRQGTGVYILRMAGYEELSTDVLNGIMPKIAPEALQNPDRFERMSLITCIGMIKIDASHEILRKIMKGEIVLPQDKFDPNETTGMPHTCMAMAARSLARFGDKQDLVLIRAEAKNAQGMDKRLFESAERDLLERQGPAENWWLK